MTGGEVSGLLEQLMPAKKTVVKTAPRKTISISLPARVTQQQLLYSLLLVATFLVGYLVATVQLLKKPSTTVAGTQTAIPTQPAPAPAYTKDDIKAWAKEVGVKKDEFASCFDAGKHQAEIDKDTADGQTAGVSGTPTFYINGVQLVGAQPFSAFKTEIDNALAGTQTGTKVAIDNGRLPALGQDSAPVTIVEFSDLECPFCHQFFKETLPQIKKDYIDTGKVKMYYRHYPLPFHPMAKPLANAVECANDQGKFWELHDTIFSKF